MAFCSVDITLGNLVILGCLYFAVKKLIKLFQQWQLEKKLEKWENSPKDKVILHGFQRSTVAPSLSPFVMKLETYLRMANIPYEFDGKSGMGPKGKVPWITLNGVHVGDSHLIIQYLNKKFSVNLNKKSTEEQLATASACRLMLENHWFYGMAYYVWVDNPSAIANLVNIPTIMKLIFLPSRSYFIKKRLENNGIGLHTPAEIYQMTEDDLRTASTLLGNNKFFGGDEPCEDDSAMFGMIGQTVWALPGSSFRKLVDGELPNLKGYVERMKELYWPDWNDCLDYK